MRLTSWWVSSGHSYAAPAWCTCARLRPEFVRDAFARYKITYVTLVPMILKNLERGLRAKFDELSPLKRFLLDRMISLNKLLTEQAAEGYVEPQIVAQVSQGFRRRTAGHDHRRRFHRSRRRCSFSMIWVFRSRNGYGLTEACTVLTVNDLKPFRADTVGKPLPELSCGYLNPDADGIGEVVAHSKTVMSHYLDDPELTAQTIVDGWLLTGDLGRFDGDGHLQLFGRKKNMIVTEGGKNIYPEDIENAFDGLPVKEYCIFAANYLWPDEESGPGNAGSASASGARSGIHRSSEETRLSRATGACRTSSGWEDMCSGIKISRELHP